MQSAEKLKGRGPRDAAHAEHEHLPSTTGWRVIAESQRLAAWSKIALVGLFIIGVLVAVDLSSFFIVPVTTAFIIGLTLGPVIDKLERLGLPPRLASIVVLASIVGATYGLSLFLAAPLEEWSARTPEIMDKLRRAIFWIRDPLEQINEIGKQVKEVATPGEGKLEVAVEQSGIVANALISTPAILAQLMIFVGTFYFYSVSRNSVRTAILAFAPSFAARVRVARAIRDIELSLSGYVLSITVINVTFGVVIAIAMWLLGMPVPALWGAIAAILNYLQFIGPAIMTIIIAGIALITFDTATATMLPPLVFICLNLLEGQFLTPTLLGSRMVVNPLAVFLSLAFWLWMWGPVGAFLAVPLLIIGATVAYHALPPGRRSPFAFGRRKDA